MGEQGFDGADRAEQARVRAERALRDGRAELAESRVRAERASRDPAQQRAGAAAATPPELRAAAVAFRERAGLAPVLAPLPPAPEPRRRREEDPGDEDFGDAGVLYRA